MSKKEFTSCADVLQGIFQNGKCGLSHQFIRWRLWRRWREVAGPTIAQNTDPVAFEHGTLFIWVKSSAWMQQLFFSRQQLLENINREVGYAWAKNIKFTLDRKSVPKLTETAEDLQSYLAKEFPNKDGGQHSDM